MQVVRFTRQQFYDRAWSYKAGEHATFIGKTQSGKTTLAFELLDRTATPEMPALVLVMKPKDRTPERYGKRLGYKRVTSWPPPSASRWNPSPPRGWLVWPKLGDIDKDRGRLYGTFRHAMAESYAGAARRRRGGARIIFADEVVGISRQLKLGDELDEIWMRGSGMDLGLWAACQRPYNAPLNAYEQSVHLFLWKSTDRRNVKRFGEIGGIPAKQVEEVVSGLGPHECFYIRRTDYTCCVIAAA